jgi:LysM repeat protein
VIAVVQFYRSAICKRGWPVLVLLTGLGLGACQAQPAPLVPAIQAAQPEVQEVAAAIEQPQATPLPTRPPYSPGELVDYTVQTGDTLPALVAHFNTSIEEIRQANPIIPQDVTTLPPGMPMKIPIYYAPLWGSPFKIIPDGLFVNGPAQVNFDTQAFIAGHPGWLNGYVEYASDANRSAAEIIDLVARNFSVSPRLLLTLVEYESGGLSQSVLADELKTYPLGNANRRYRGLYGQLIWAANTLNNAYYQWRSGELQTIFRQDGSLERPDPWQNAASVAIKSYYSRLRPLEGYLQATGPEGVARVYQALFGDPWQADSSHLPGSLTQPTFMLPFEVGTTWALTGGPHTGWGTGEPYAALDFAPPSVKGGCVPTQEWVTAVAPGLVIRSEPGVVVLDLDKDGDERTGWVIFHLHVATEGRAPVGKELDTGHPLGHPSCEGGTSTGTHVHMARKFNGEWILAQGPLAFNLEGWVAQNGAAPYLGTMTRFGRTVEACVCSDHKTFLTAGERGE